MKKFLGLSFVFVCLLVSACKDGELECSADSVVGVYSGVDACNDNNVHDETINITSTSDSNIISYVDDEGVTFTTTLIDCTTETVELDQLGGVEKKTYDLVFSESDVILTTEVKVLGLSNGACQRILNKQ